MITKGENILFSYYFWVITKYADSSIQNLWQICEEFSSFERKCINQLHVYICFMSIFIHYSFFKIESKIIFQYLQYQLLLNNLKSKQYSGLIEISGIKQPMSNELRMNRLTDICVPPLPFLFYSLLTSFHNHKN